MKSLAYLDHAATTPARPEVIAAITEELATGGNASSLHTVGRAARKVVEESREAVAHALGCGPSEVVFTSGGTESDNLAVKGTWWQRRGGDPKRNRLLIGATEHHAVLDAVEHLVHHEGAIVDWIDVDRSGRSDPSQVRELIERDPDSVALVSLMWANNEVGAIQPVADVASVAHEHGIPMHTDAVQAIGQVPVDFTASGADLLTASAHKFGGPQGVGVLVARRDASLVPLTHGGGQERQLRSGTLNTPGIRGMAVAATLAMQELPQEQEKLAALRDKLIRGALDLGLDIEVTGAHEVGDVTARLAGNAHLRVPGCDGDSLLYLLDAAGIECSTGSACQAGVPQPSHVLLAMGISEDDARGALRLTLGHTSTDADVAAFLAALPAAVDRARRARSASRGGR
ncbi:cysteine desulfurase [Flexivirga endophytica]|uniref:Cysteine desulfurase n=1 Tax=Flexivirga endophytica TaxID=1849103 RepID=A0A916WMU6_9MICO|nr:cysteine desulfurase family protein [Flexivirga endophytica]GGB15928.1 cysteine desulfurase [Flexivirga endophytica]GHB39671.1 cysteine desulfurase [Flexivirga endophytica]